MWAATPAIRKQGNLYRNEGEIKFAQYQLIIADIFQEDRKQKNDTSLQIAAGQLEPVGKIQMKTRRQLRGGWSYILDKW